MPNKRSLLILVLLAGMSLLSQGCGRVLARPTPTRRANTPIAITPSLLSTPSSDQPLPATPTTTATATSVLPTPTFTPTPRPGEAVRVGLPARVVATAGVNVREIASTGARLVGMFAPGALLSVKDGPVQAEGYRWWLVADSTGLLGWVAEGTAVEPWLSADIGEPRPINRAVLLGDDVVVSASPSLVLRFQAGTSSVVARRAGTGERFTVRDGPVDVDGLHWWMLVDDQSREYWAAEARDNERWLMPIE